MCVFILKIFSNVVKHATFEHILAALNNRKGLMVYHFEYPSVNVSLVEIVKDAAVHPCM